MYDGADGWLGWEAPRVLSPPPRIFYTTCQNTYEDISEEDTLLGIRHFSAFSQQGANFRPIFSIDVIHPLTIFGAQQFQGGQPKTGEWLPMLITQGYGGGDPLSAKNQDTKILAESAHRGRSYIIRTTVNR